MLEAILSIFYLQQIVVDMERNNFEMQIISKDQQNILAMIQWTFSE